MTEKATPHECARLAARQFYRTRKRDSKGLRGIIECEMTRLVASKDAEIESFRAENDLLRRELHKEVTAKRKLANDSIDQDIDRANLRDKLAKAEALLRDVPTSPAMIPMMLQEKIGEYFQDKENGDGDD